MFLVTAEDILKIEYTKERLIDCLTEEDVNGVFDRYEITDFSVKTMLLRLSRLVQVIFVAPSDKSVSEEDIYKKELEYFLKRKWSPLLQFLTYSKYCYEQHHRSSDYLQDKKNSASL